MMKAESIDCVAVAAVRRVPAPDARDQRARRILVLGVILVAMDAVVVRRAVT